jgi:hypothetical protein
MPLSTCHDNHNRALPSSSWTVTLHMTTSNYLDIGSHGLAYRLLRRRSRPFSLFRHLQRQSQKLRKSSACSITIAFSSNISPGLPHLYMMASKSNPQINQRLRIPAFASNYMDVASFQTYQPLSSNAFVKWSSIGDAGDD